MWTKKYLHLCNADTWLCPWHRADYFFVTLCFQENPYLFTKTNSNTVISELISDDDQDSATDDFPPAAAVALAVCLTAVVVIVVVFVWRTRKSRRRPEARKLLYALGPHKPRIWVTGTLMYKLSFNLPRALFLVQTLLHLQPSWEQTMGREGKGIKSSGLRFLCSLASPAPCFLHTSHAPTTPPQWELR